LKEKLKKTIVRIVKEHFKKTGSIRGLYKDERDHFYTELYSYLVASMRKTVQGMVEKKRNELHETVVSKDLEQPQRERNILIEQSTKEKELERCRRLCEEAENLSMNVVEAEKYMKKIMESQEGNSEAMMEMSKFYLKWGKIDKAETFMRDAYSFNIKNRDFAIAYATFLIQIGRSKEAFVILKKLEEEKYRLVLTYLLMSQSFEADSDPILAQKYKAKADLCFLRET